MNSKTTQTLAETKEKSIAFVPVIVSAIITGIVSGVVTVATLTTDVDWIKSELSDLNDRVLHIERESKYGKSRTEIKRTT